MSRPGPQMILNADYDFGDYYNDDCGDHESLVGVHLKKKILVGIHLTNTLSFYLSPGELLLRQNRIFGQSEQSTTNNFQSLQSEQSNTNNLQSLQNQPYQIVIWTIYHQTNFTKPTIWDCRKMQSTENNLNNPPPNQRAPVFTKSAISDCRMQSSEKNRTELNQIIKCPPNQTLNSRLWFLMRNNMWILFNKEFFCTLRLNRFYTTMLMGCLFRC